MPQNKKLDVMSVSDLCVDLLLRGNVRPKFGQAEQLIENYELELGGSANIFAVQFANLGGRAGLIGRAGADIFGRFALETLDRSRVDTSRVVVDPEIKTGLGVALTEPHDRAILTYSGSIDAVTPEQLRALDPRAFSHWHIASYFLLTRLRAEWPRFCSELIKYDVTVSLDTNWDPEDRWEDVTDLLPLTDVFLPNAAEALAITGERDLHRAGSELAKLGPLVVIKQGADGATAFIPNESEPLRVKPERTLSGREIVDCVGAGDCFDAGFLRAWKLGLSLEEALRWGLRCGAANLTAAGGIAGQVRQNISGADIPVCPKTGAKLAF
ncbi:MAG TPA: carbohydrate kinase family protein [Planctomycetota bacterium]|nr:carbohydrate kinase family protein [Planctomycetota bacterium]